MGWGHVGVGWGVSCRVGWVGHVEVGWVMQGWCGVGHEIHRWGGAGHVRVGWAPLSVDMRPYGCFICFSVAGIQK